MAMSISIQADNVKTLIDLEQQRCNAMVHGDTERLRELLHRDLVHVHAKGQVDGFDSYSARAASTFTTKVSNARSSPCA